MNTKIKLQNRRNSVPKAKMKIGAKGKKAVCQTVSLKPNQRKYLDYHAKLSGIPIKDSVEQAIEDWLEVSYPTDVGRLEKALGLPSTLVPA
jgi:hypothetical protein